MPRIIEPLPGVYKNGNRWWLRTVHAPLANTARPVSTGTSDVARANRIKQMVDDFRENPRQFEWLSRAVDGTASLDQLYTHHAAGTLAQLAAQLTAKAASNADADLDPWVTKWVKEHLGALELRERTKTTYERQVRFFIPADVPFPKSRLTEDWIKAKVSTMTGARGDRDAKVSGSTKRRTLVALEQFIRYAKKRVPLDRDPLADVDWMPKNGSPRSTFHEHETIVSVLDRMAGEDRAAMALIYGCGIELGALLAMKYKHVGSVRERTIIAPGSKNEHREDRTIFVDKWAWEIFYKHLSLGTPNAPLWSYSVKNGGRELREAFYAAQVAAGLINAPETSAETRKKLWGRVQPHTLHDARHSYCINRSLGLDGEEPQDVTFCAAQLGHADEQMVLKIYKKANVKERLRLIQQQQRMKAAKAAGEK